MLGLPLDELSVNNSDNLMNFLVSSLNIFGDGTDISATVIVYFPAQGHRRCGACSKLPK